MQSARHGHRCCRLGRQVALRKFIRPLDPNKGLDVYHILGFEIAQVMTNESRKIKQAVISLDGGSGLVLEVEAILDGGDARHIGFEKDVYIWPGEKSKNGDDGPGQYARLLAGKHGYRFAPTPKFDIRFAWAMEEIVESLREQAGADSGFHRVADGHFFEREEQIGPGFDFDRVAG